MSSSMQNMKTTTMTWHTSTALIRSFLPMSRKNIITIMTRKGSTIATAMKTVNTITIMMKKASTTTITTKKANIIITMTKKASTIARTSMARKDTIIITMMKNITARISMAKRAIIMIMTTFMAITTIMNTAIWRMSWRSLTALP